MLAVGLRGADRRRPDHALVRRLQDDGAGVSELGLDVITGPFKRAVCRIRGHRLVPGSAWQGSMACGRCGLGVRVSCSCRFDRPSARDLTGHRHDCPLHPPAGWPHDHQRPVGRVRVVEDEHGIRPVPWAEQRPAEQRPAEQRARSECRVDSVDIECL